MSTPRDGTILTGRYLLGKKLGSGGMGSVYVATDLRTGGRVAVKLLHAAMVDEPDAVPRLRREAEMAAALTSPRVVRVVDFATDPETGATFLVQEFVDGETLEAMLRRRGRLPVAEALHLTREIARALAAAHRAGIVHRDLKPSNIMLTEGQVKVLDFGLARLSARGNTLTAAGIYIGTPAYSAPEQGSADQDIRSDLYAAGVVLYEMLAGHVPFDGPNAVALLRMHAMTPPPPLPDDVPPIVQSIVLRCLEKEPEDRYQSPDGLLADLDAALADGALLGGSTAPLPPAPSPSRPAMTRPLPPAAHTVTVSPGRATSPTQPPAPEASSSRPSVMQPDAMQPPFPSPAPPRSGGRKLPVLLAGGAAAVLGVLVIGFVLSRGGGSNEQAGTATAPVAAASATAAGTSPAGTVTATAAARLDPRALTAALARTPMDPRMAPGGMTAQPPQEQTVAEADKGRGVEGQAQISFREATDLFSHSATYYIYKDDASARARFDTGYKSGGSLTITEQAPPSDLQGQAVVLSGTSSLDGTPVGIAFCIVVSGNVELRATSARGFPNDSGDTARACEVARAALSHLRRVQGGG